MNSRCMRVIAAVAVLILFTFSGFAQDVQKKRWSAPTLDGTFWSVQDLGRRNVEAVGDQTGHLAMIWSPAIPAS